MFDYQGLALTASPYSVDPDGLPANEPPFVDPVHLAPLPSKCKIHPEPCDEAARYRTISGHCNNLIHKEYGAAGHLLARMNPPVYDEALMRTRSVLGGLLPNPRVISLRLLDVPLAPASPRNLLVMQMGQFIDHDLSVTSVIKDADGKKRNCRPCTSWREPWCAPVPLPKYDPFISARVEGTGERRCLPFIRSVAQGSVDASGRTILQQINLNTAFLDLSPIYGNDECTEKQLRQFYGGLLKSSLRHHLLTLPADFFAECNTPDQMCFFSGDGRVNENLGLSVIHTLYHREHNRLAEALRWLNPHWQDERIYQEARRVNIAQYQHSLYKEYLPVVIGYEKAARHKLIPQHDGYFLGYDDKVNPAILNEFSTAAFRMGHSQIPNTLVLIDPHYQLHSTVPIETTFHNTTFILSERHYDYVLRGMIQLAASPSDLSLADSVRHKLFKKEGKPHSGEDLFVLNILRGRDHGLASYVTYLSVCGIREVSSFHDLKPLMADEIIAILKATYTHVQDVDLFVGGLGEDHLPGALVGPTFACIITQQFLILKTGDRFWYESGDAGFSHEQLESLRTSSLARTICDNMDDANTQVPPKAYFQPDEETNPLRVCSSLPATNLSLWREEPDAEPGLCRHEGKVYRAPSKVPVSSCLLCVCQPNGRVRCQCDLSGCQLSSPDYYCKMICPRREQNHGSRT
ncbi:salivary peroxidase/catechol oxidase-like isoform X2 [Panulirus ornatus]|uniref:salivary peroxidase/catechol oxidase-like isoform X1 n=1 Tax=Panulirus ornatus TaxID=150431 RepID=UPI003A86F41A